MIKQLLLKPPSALRLLAPDGTELAADADGYFDVSEHPALISQHPDWELKKVEG